MAYRRARMRESIRGEHHVAKPPQTTPRQRTVLHLSILPLRYAKATVNRIVVEKLTRPTYATKFNGLQMGDDVAVLPGGLLNGFAGGIRVVASYFSKA